MTVWSVFQKPVIIYAFSQCWILHAKWILRYSKIAIISRNVVVSSEAIQVLICILTSYYSLSDNCILYLRQRVK